MITATKLLKQVRKIARENPDYRYPTTNCRYYSEVDGMCIVGQALSDLGVDVKKTFYRKWFNQRGIITIFDVLPELQRDDDDSVYTLGEVQRLQDMRKPWGQCV